MKHTSNSLVPQIEASYHSFTATEKIIADYFISEEEENKDYSSKAVSKKLFVSESALSRFAKKCGYVGYREFIYDYKSSFHEKASQKNTVRQVLDTYQELLNKIYSVVDGNQLERICELFRKRKRVIVDGLGSSGLVAQELKFRFMRIGMNIEAITDSQIMKMSAVILDEDCIAVGISVSGETQEVILALDAAKKCGIYTIFVTSKRANVQQYGFDEVVTVPAKQHLEYGKSISPQFPVLMIMDIVYAYYLKKDTRRKESLHEYTIQSIRG